MGNTGWGTGAGVLAGSPALQTGGPGEGGSGAALFQPQTQNHHTTPHTLSGPCISYLEAP